MKVLRGHRVKTEDPETNTIWVFSEGPAVVFGWFDGPVMLFCLMTLCVFAQMQRIRLIIQEVERLMREK